MIVDSELDDIHLTTEFSGLPTICVINGTAADNGENRITIRILDKKEGTILLENTFYYKN